MTMSTINKRRMSLSLGLFAVFAASSAFAQTTLTTIAGNGTGSVQLGYHYGLAKDSAGNMYIADVTGHVVRKITTSGLVSVYAGINGTMGSVNGPKATATFSFPKAIAADPAGNIYVTDAGHALRKIDVLTGIVSTLVSPSGWGTSGNVPIFALQSMAADGNGNVYLSERLCNCIRKVTAAGVISIYAGGNSCGASIDGTAATATFNDPQGLALDSAGNLFVADRGNRRVRKITPAGMVTTLAGTGIEGHVDGPGGVAQFYLLWGITVAPNGVVYVNDGNQANGPLGLNTPIYSYLRSISSAGVVRTVLGGPFGRVDGNLANARITSLSGLTTHDHGIYMMDFENRAIRRVATKNRIVDGGNNELSPPPPLPN